MSYIVVVVNDVGTPLYNEKGYKYSSAIEAVNAYNAFLDYGYSTYSKTIILIEPDGSMYHKTYYGHSSDKPVEFREETRRYQVNS